MFHDQLILTKLCAYNSNFVIKKINKATQNVNQIHRDTNQD